jgi:hypothetical protein
MLDCSFIVEQFMPQFQEMIRETEKNEREHAFGFSQDKATKIYVGDCNDIERPTIKNQLGTAHNHTINWSQPSPEDFETFKQSKDKFMCYATPIANDTDWRVRCYDRDLGVCAESMFSYPIDEE